MFWTSDALQVAISVAAFALWLGLLFVVLSSSPFRQLRFEVAALLAGLYMARLSPTMYALSGTYAVLAALGIVGMLHSAKECCIKLKELLGLDATLCGLVDPMDIPLKIVGAVCACVRHLLGIPDDSGVQTTRMRAWLFFIWFPLAWPWTLVLQTTLLVMLGSLVLLGFLIAAEFKNENVENVLTCWLALRRHMRRASTLAVSSMVVYWCILRFAHLLFSCSVTIVAAGLVTFLLWADSSIFEDVKERLNTVLDLCGSTDAQSWLEMQASMMIWPIVSALNQMGDEVKRCDKEKLATWCLAGFVFGMFITLISMACIVSAQLSAAFAPSMLACFLAIASSLDVMNMAVSLGRTFGFSLGALCAQSVVAILTGRVAGLYMGFGLDPFMILMLVIVKAVWVWLSSILVVASVVFYVGPLKFRLLLLKVWWVNNGGQEEEALSLPYDINEICFTSLETITADRSSFRVKFTTDCPFNLDQVDLGGLSKEWATLFAQGLTQGSKHLMWPLLRKWDPDSKSFHLNYESRAAESMKETAAAFDGAPYEDFTLMEEEDIEKMFYKLGVVIAKCFLRDFQLVPLSTALIKFVFRNDDKDSRYATTFADLQELCPSMARNMRSSPEYCPFEEISLPGEIISSFDVVTGFQDGDFNPEKEPTEEQWDSLADSVLENQHVLPLLKSFKLGFRTVLEGINIGELFSVAEVQQLMQGSVSITIGDWHAHTCYVECSSNHPIVKAFWREMHELSQLQLQAFCQFVTGSKTPPIEGFSALIPRFTVRVTGDIDKINAHTCFNSVDLPAAMDTSMMKVALTDICGDKMD